MNKIERIDRYATELVLLLQDQDKKNQKRIISKLKERKRSNYILWVIGRADEILAYGVPIETYEDYKKAREERLLKVIDKQGGKVKNKKETVSWDDSILGLILLQGDMPSKHKKIFSAINDVWLEGDPVDLVTLLNKLKDKGQADEIGGASYLAYLVDNAPLSFNRLLGEGG